MHQNLLFTGVGFHYDFTESQAASRLHFAIRVKIVPVRSQDIKIFEKPESKVHFKTFKKIIHLMTKSLKTAQ